MSHQAFVSSTFLDLKEHRAHVINQLRRSGIHVDPMEDWTADADEPKKFSQERVEGCDLCILLVAFRRGCVPDGETKSITQLEYQAAKDMGIDIHVHMLDEDAPWPRRYDDMDKDPGIRTWRDELKKRHGVATFQLDPKTIDISPALTRWMAERTPPPLPSTKGIVHNSITTTDPHRYLAWLGKECGSVEIRGLQVLCWKELCGGGENRGRLGLQCHF
jgi:hypothetical protein